MVSVCNLRMLLRGLAALAGGFAVATVCAAEMHVSLNGIFGKRAVLVVDGADPQIVTEGGQTREGVRLVSIRDGAAVVEVDGRRQQLRVGDGPIRTAPAADAMAGGGQEVRIVSDARGHFSTRGAINGAAMQFLVDTGATLVSLGVADARRAGINYLGGAPSTSMTANGAVRVWLVRLDRVQVGSLVLRNVDGAVHEAPLPFVLLGSSFLQRVAMQREGDTLILRRRF